MASHCKYEPILNGARIIVAVTLVNFVASVILPVNYYKIFVMATGFLAAKLYWDLSDLGWFSIPLFIIEGGLIWAIYYWISVDPPAHIFIFIFNRFADLAFFYIIGCAIHVNMGTNRERIIAAQEKVMRLPPELR